MASRHPTAGIFLSTGEWTAAPPFPSHEQQRDVQGRAVGVGRRGRQLRRAGVWRLQAGPKRLQAFLHRNGLSGGRLGGCERFIEYRLARGSTHSWGGPAPASPPVTLLFSSAVATTTPTQCRRLCPARWRWPSAPPSRPARCALRPAARSQGPGSGRWRDGGAGWGAGWRDRRAPVPPTPPPLEPAPGPTAGPAAALLGPHCACTDGSSAARPLQARQAAKFQVSAYKVTLKTPSGACHRPTACLGHDGAVDNAPGPLHGGMARAPSPSLMRPPPHPARGAAIAPARSARARCAALRRENRPGLAARRKPPPPPLTRPPRSVFFYPLQASRPSSAPRTPTSWTPLRRPVRAAILCG